MIGSACNCLFIFGCYAFITTCFIHLAGHIYLDGTDKETEQVWKHNTGELLLYTNFHHNEGRDVGPACAAFASLRNFLWADVPCNHPKDFICEIDLY